MTTEGKWPMKTHFQQWDKAYKTQKGRKGKAVTNYEKRSYIHFSCSAETWLPSSVKKPGEVKNHPRNAVECHDVTRRLQRMSFLYFQLTIIYLLSHKL